MADRRIGKKVKSVSVFFSSLQCGCDYFIEHDGADHFMTNEQAQDLTVVQMRDAVKSDRLRLSKKRRKGVQYDGQKQRVAPAGRRS